MHMEVVRKIEADPTQKTGFAFDFDKAKNACDAYDSFKASYRARDAARFASASHNLNAALQALSPGVYPSETVLKAEVSYNNIQPFVWSWVFYLLAAVTALFALRFKSRPPYIAAMTLFVTGLAIHVYGFVLRCYIAGRPPVSNMYE